MQLDGQFVWHELWTTDTAAAAAFYRELVGWSYYDYTMEDGSVYKMPTVGEKQIGGLVTLPADTPAPPHWVGYVATADVDAAAARAVELGGKLLMPPADIPNVGRFAKIADPAGAVFFLFKTAGPEMETPPPPPVPGMFCWNELLAEDLPASAKYYSALFGWESGAGEAAEREYLLFKLHGKEVAGAMPSPPESAVGTAWMHYILVEDLDATVARVEPLGGRIYMPPTAIKSVGRFAVVADPTGAVVALFTPEKA